MIPQGDHTHLIDREVDTADQSETGCRFDFTKLVSSRGQGVVQMRDNAVLVRDQFGFALERQRGAPVDRLADLDPSMESELDALQLFMAQAVFLDELQIVGAVLDGQRHIILRDTALIRNRFKAHFIVVGYAAR